MSGNNDNDNDGPFLEDLQASVIRAKNDDVDEEMTQLEEKAEELRDDLAEKKAELEQAKEEKEAATKLLEQFRDEQKNQHIKRIEQANKVVDEENETDLSSLEEASPAVLEVVADRMEQLAEAASGSVQSASNTGTGPDFSNIDDNDVSPDSVSDAMAKVAEENGLGSSYEALQSNDFGSPMSSGNREQTETQEIADAINNLAGGS